jgi:hypothetical protein
MTARLRADFSDEGEISDSDEMEFAQPNPSGKHKGGQMWSAMIQAEDLGASFKTLPIDDAAKKLKMVERDTESFPAPLLNDFKLPKAKKQKPKVCFRNLIIEFLYLFEIAKF